MRNLKLIEAIGLLFVLGAWFFEWQSVRKWNDAESDYYRFVSSYNDAVFKMKDQIQGQFEIAITRCVQGVHLNPSDFASAYRIAWPYAEVRKVWWERAVAGLSRVEGLLKNLSDFSQRYGLALRTDLIALDEERAAIARRVSECIDIQDPSNKIVPIPSVERLSIVQAGGIDNQTRDLNYRLTPAINEVASGMKAKRIFWSWVHRALFALGSILLVGTKVAEWMEKWGPNKADAVDARTSRN